MMLDEQDLQKLLRLKRLEQPPPGYFDRALNEFHRRQREELLRHSAGQIWFDRLVSRFWSFRVPNYAYGVAFGIFVVAASIVGSGVWAPVEAMNGSSAAQTRVAKADNLPSHIALSGDLDWSKFERRSAPVSRVVPDLQPSQSALPRYVIDGRPLSREASFSF
jgi:hypothetical protein